MKQSYQKQLEDLNAAPSAGGGKERECGERNGKKESVSGVLLPP